MRPFSALVCVVAVSVASAVVVCSSAVAGVLAPHSRESQVRSVDAVARSSVFTVRSPGVAARLVREFERLAESEFRRDVGLPWPRDAVVACNVFDRESRPQCDAQASFRPRTGRSRCLAFTLSYQARIDPRTGAISFRDLHNPVFGPDRLQPSPGVPRFGLNPFYEGPTGPFSAPLASERVDGRVVAIRRDAAGGLWLTESGAPWIWRSWLGTADGTVSGGAHFARTRPCRAPRRWMYVGTVAATHAGKPGVTSVRVTVPRKHIRVQRRVKPPVFLVVLPASVTGWDWAIISYHNANRRVVARLRWGPLNQALGSDPDTSHGNAFAPLDAYSPPLTIPEPIGLRQPQARISQRSAGGEPEPPARLEFDFEVTGVKLAGGTLGQPARVGEGYLHFSLNDGRFDQPRYSGQSAVLAANLGLQGRYSVAFKPAITYRNLPPGRYRLAVYLANNDHTHTGIGEQVPFIIRPRKR